MTTEVFIVSVMGISVMLGAFNNLIIFLNISKKKNLNCSLTLYFKWFQTYSTHIRREGGKSRIIFFWHICLINISLIEYLVRSWLENLRGFGWIPLKVVNQTRQKHTRSRKQIYFLWKIYTFQKNILNEIFWKEKLLEF